MHAQNGFARGEGQKRSFTRKNVKNYALFFRQSGGGKHTKKRSDAIRFVCNKLVRIFFKITIAFGNKMLVGQAVNLSINCFSFC